MAQTNHKLDFNVNKYQVQTVTFEGKAIAIRAYENLVYVENPVDTSHQVMNIYIPEEYFNNKIINGYKASSAPVFFPNKVGGYMPAKPATAVTSSSGNFQGGPPRSGASAVVVALSRGYIVASAGARGRTSKNGAGSYTGKSPAAIVDLKAAIRYLRYNDKKMPGDASKIISNGTSAGGAMSTLLGATGNNPDYLPYLEQLGAAKASDAIFAVSAYCPIINLENADLAYEWQFNGVNTYKRGGPPGAGNNSQASGNTLTPQQVKVSDDLKKGFPSYVNSLHLTDLKNNPLTLDEQGNGSFKEQVKSYVISAAQKVIDTGKDLSNLSWLTIVNSKVTAIDFDAYVRYMERMKTPPAFDALDLSSGENQEFGTDKTDKQHFTQYGVQHSTVSGKLADATIVKMLNPMAYIGAPKTNTALHWRIRHGSKDKDTGLGIPVILATRLQNKGYNVSLELPWDRPHSGDYDLNELFDWMDGICKSK